MGRYICCFPKGMEVGVELELEDMTDVWVLLKGLGEIGCDDIVAVDDDDAAAAADVDADEESHG